MRVLRHGARWVLAEEARTFGGNLQGSTLFLHDERRDAAGDDPASRKAPEHRVDGNAAQGFNGSCGFARGGTVTRQRRNRSTPLVSKAVSQFPCAMSVNFMSSERRFNFGIVGTFQLSDPRRILLFAADVFARFGQKWSQRIATGQRRMTATSFLSEEHDFPTKARAVTDFGLRRSESSCKPLQINKLHRWKSCDGITVPWYTNCLSPGVEHSCYLTGV